MIIAGLVLAAFAALAHVYIFYLESVAWTAPRTRATFGLTETQAEATKELAYNQGFYNLFLAVMIAAGLVFYGAGATAVGLALVVAGAGSMVAAALVLVSTGRSRASAALTQGLVPLLGLALIAVGALVQGSSS